MTDFGEDFVVEVRSEMDALWDEGGRERAKAVLSEWLGNTRKLDVPDLPERVARFESDLHRMVDGATVHFDGEKLVVRVRSSDADTFARLKYGSDWFEGESAAEEMIVGGQFNSDR